MSEKAISMENKTTLQKLVGFLIDLKFLLKGKVLVANVMPVFTGFWLALYFSELKLVDYWELLIITMVGSTLVISGALIINNWYEVDLDREMKRTQMRPTVTGHFSMKSVLWSGIICVLIGFGLMAMTTLEAFVYSFLGWFVYVVLYTFWSKRRYTLNTLIGSVSGAFTPLIGWAAIDSAYHIVPIVLFGILLIWQVPHTLVITVKRLDEYRAAGVPMLPVVCGVDVAKRQTLIYIICLLPFPFVLAPLLGWGLVVIATLLNIVWIVLAAKGFKTNNDYKWAQVNLIYSLNYLFILSIVMMVLTSEILG